MAWGSSPYAGPMLLTPTQARVLGALVEKELTTPQHYPLTLNALVTACNQSNNRDPVMSLTDAPVVDALEALREKGLVRLVHPSHGSRTTKYRQVMGEALELGVHDQALLAVLLLRGPQTLGELRTRTERLAAIDTTEEVERRLEGLAGREQPLVELLERQPGQKEPRWADVLGSHPAPTAPAASGDELSAAASAGIGAEGSAGRSHGGPARARPSSPRIRPLADHELDDQQRELVEGVTATGSASNIFLTLVRHPGLARRWLPFGGKILAGKLPGRDRELLILRTAWRCQAAYEWGHHVEIGLRVGLVEDEIARIPAGPDGGWSAHEAALLRAADELHDDASLSDETWTALAERYDERQLIEIPMVVGQYHLVSFTLNALGIQPEEGIAPLPGRE